MDPPKTQQRQIINSRRPGESTVRLSVVIQHSRQCRGADSKGDEVAGEVLVGTAV